MKRLIAALMLATFCAGLAVTADAEEIRVSAKSAVLVEALTGHVLYEKNADMVMEMASTTKLMTALVSSCVCDTETVVTVPESAAGVEGSSVYLVPGEKLTVLELLYAALLNSGNDAAETLAWAAGGKDRNAFVDMMNDTAEALGLKKTHFANPTGLPQDGHHTTARELSVIARAAARSEPLCGIMSTAGITFSDGSGRSYRNHNSLLRMYEYADGMKTGYTKSAGRCLVSSATRDGIKLICVTLNAPDDWNDHTRLYEQGFALTELATVRGAGTVRASVPVGGGCLARLEAGNTCDIVLPVFGRSAPYEFEIEVPACLFAPIVCGQRVGWIKVVCGGETVGRWPLCAKQAIACPPRPLLRERYASVLRQMLGYVLI